LVFRCFRDDESTVWDERTEVGRELKVVGVAI